MHISQKNGKIKGVEVCFAVCPTNIYIIFEKKKTICRNMIYGIENLSCFDNRIWQKIHSLCGKIFLID